MRGETQKSLAHAHDLFREDMSMDSITSTVTRTLDTKILMGASAGMSGLFGLGALFFTHPLLSILGMRPEKTVVALVSIAGVLYLSFAVLNWMARGNLIGGIYSRPVAMGNFAHFLGGTIVFAKQVPAVAAPGIVGAIGGIYALFAIGFGYVAFARGGSCG